MRPLARPLMLGLLSAAALILLIAVVGQLAGRPPEVPWVCDDTRYVDTVPVGRAVVGPAVSAAPGCGT